MVSPFKIAREAALDRSAGAAKFLGKRAGRQAAQLAASDPQLLHGVSKCRCTRCFAAIKAAAPPA